MRLPHRPENTPRSAQPEPTATGLPVRKAAEAVPRLRRGQRPTVQLLTATRARGYALTKGLAPLIIVEEHPPVLVLIRLPPEFGPDSFPALVLICPWRSRKEF